MPHSGSVIAAVRLFGFCTVRVRRTDDRGRKSRPVLSREKKKL